MYNTNKIILKRLIIICTVKLQNAATLLLSNNEKSPENTELYKQFAQMHEVLSWAMDLLRNYIPNDLFLFSQMAGEIERTRTKKQRPDKIDQDRIEHIYKLMNDPEYRAAI